MPITLQQELAVEQPKIRAAIIQTLVEVSPLARRVPMESTGNLNITATYISDIPTITPRFINEAASEVSVSHSQIQRALAIMENYIDIDPVLLDNSNQFQKIDVAQSQGVVQSMAFKFVDLYVNGDPVSNNPRDPVGMKRALGEDPRFNGQTINATANSTELNLAVGTAADADYRNMFNLFNQTLARVNNKADIFLTNWNAILTIEAAAKQLRLFNTAADQYDREIMVYKGTSWIDAGWKASGAVAGSYPAGGVAGDLVIGNDSEAVTATNGGNTYDKQTPIYAIRFGADYQMGLQQVPMTVKTGIQTTVSPFYLRTMIRWVIDPAAMFQKRSAARLVGCNFSGVTS